MVVARRDGELGMLPARGGSVRQLGAATGRGALIAALPGALSRAGLAVALVPGGTAVPPLGLVAGRRRGRGRAGRPAADRGLAASPAGPGRAVNPARVLGAGPARAG